MINLLELSQHCKDMIEENNSILYFENSELPPATDSMINAIRKAKYLSLNINDTLHKITDMDFEFNQFKVKYKCGFRQIFMFDLALYRKGLFRIATYSEANFSSTGVGKGDRIVKLFDKNKKQITL